MKIVFISDTHFGDPDSTLVQQTKSEIRPGSRYHQFKKAAGTGNDYLVLMGDIFDFSVASYADAYRNAQGFFQQIQKDNIAKRLLYLSGNHDADMWHILQHQRSVIKPLERHELPQSFEHAIPAVFDDRKRSPLRNIVLGSVARKKGKEPYGGMFLDDITDPPSTFYFAYPNLYIITETETVLVTHGQYLEVYWAVLGETIPQIAREDIPPERLDIETMAEVNFPLNQFGCTGIGQAGVLTPIARAIEKEVEEKKLGRIATYIDRIIGIIDDKLHVSGIAKWAVNLALKFFKGKILDALANKTQTRYSEEFLTKPDVQQRFKQYYIECLRELEEIAQQQQTVILPPDKILFGHTHQPISWNNPLIPPKGIFPNDVKLYNTGGWLETGGKFCGAEVFVYETGKGFSSITIR